MVFWRFYGKGQTEMDHLFSFMFVVYDRDRLREDHKVQVGFLLNNLIDCLALLVTWRVFLLGNITYNIVRAKVFTFYGKILQFKTEMHFPFMVWSWCKMDKTNGENQDTIQDHQPSLFYVQKPYSIVHNTSDTNNKILTRWTAVWSSIYGNINIPKIVGASII